MRKLSFLIAAVLCSDLAVHAQETPPPDPNATLAPAPAPPPPVAQVNTLANAKAQYPDSFIERPLILPALMAQPAVVLGFTNVANLDTGEVLSASFDIGIMRSLQAGLLIAFPIHPNPNFGTLAANVQYGLNPLVNARLDLGVERLSIAGPAGAGAGALNASSTGFLFGIGAPFKWKLHRMLAITSGSPQARAFESPLQVAFNGVSIYGSGFILSNDIFAMLIGDNFKVGVLSLPIGVLFSPHERVAFGLRTGYRLGFTIPSGPGNTETASFVPLALDVEVNIIKLLDVGFTFMFPGQIDGPASSSYSDVRQFEFWVQARF